MKVGPNSPSVRFSKVLDNTKSITMLIGINVMERKFRYKPLTCLTIGLCSLFMCFTIYTVLNEAFTSADWKSALKYCVMMGSGLQCSTRLLTSILKHSAMRRSGLFCEQLYRIYEQRSEEYAENLSKCVDKVESVIQLMRLGYFIIFTAMVGLPVVLWLTDGPRYLVLQYHIPGLDADTDAGYYITNAVHGASIIIAGFGLYAGDLYVMIFMAQAKLFSSIMRLRVADLNNMLANQQAGHYDSADITQELYGIVRWHQLYLKFSDLVIYFTNSVVATQVLTSALSTTITIIILLTSSWPMAYLYLPLTYYSMIVYCILGTQIEFDNDTIEYEAYNINWYLMNVAQRKIVRLLLMSTQKPKTYMIMSVIPLTVGTALDLTRTIYSLSMMITNTGQQHGN